MTLARARRAAAPSAPLVVAARSDNRTERARSNKSVREPGPRPAVTTGRCARVLPRPPDVLDARRGALRSSLEVPLSDLDRSMGWRCATDDRRRVATRGRGLSVVGSGGVRLASVDIDPSMGFWTMDPDSDGTCVVERALGRCVLARVRSGSAAGVELGLSSTGFGTTCSDSAC